MNKKVNILFRNLRDIIKDCEKFCFICRDKQYQENAIKNLSDFLKNDLKPLKKYMIYQKDEDSANCLLSLENFADSMINELKMLIALKEGSPDEAWKYLVTSQGAIRMSAQAHSISEKLNVEDYLQKLILLEKLLFPPQLFFSMGIIEKEVECSICGKDYDKCNHVVGKPYMGKMCCRIIKKSELQEISIVKNPANKLARALETSDNKGIKRNYLSWKKVREKSDNIVKKS